MGKRERPTDSLKAINEEEFGRMTRKLQFALAHKNIHQAHHIIDEYARSQGIKVRLSVSDPVSMVASPITANALEAAGYLTIQSVMAASDQEILDNTDNVGVNRLAQLRAAIGKCRFV